MWYVFDMRTQVDKYEAAFHSPEDARQWAKMKYSIDEGKTVPDFIVVTNYALHGGSEPKSPPFHSGKQMTWRPQ